MSDTEEQHGVCDCRFALEACKRFAHGIRKDHEYMDNETLERKARLIERVASVAVEECHDD